MVLGAFSFCLFDPFALVDACPLAARRLNLRGPHGTVISCWVPRAGQAPIQLRLQKPVSEHTHVVSQELCCF
jgi:hypothetical protein